MSRKVFMSVLGTGRYSECRYKGRRPETTTKYIQVATLNEIGASSWGKDDLVCILLTQKAREENWTPEDKEGLKTALQRIDLKCKVEGVDILDGKDEAEMWDIFDTVFNLLKEDDELYFDLTHGFRYLPMFMLVLSNYAKFLKNTRVAYMAYGNWEAGRANGGIAPIVDLSPLSVLQDWTTAASSFKESGRVEVLVDTIKGDNKKLPQNLFELQKNLEAFQLQLETCCGKQICDGNAADNVKGYIAKVLKDKSLPAPTDPILQSITNELKPFNANSIMNIKSALQWCKKYGLVQQGYILCQEGIVTVICEKFKDYNPYDGKKANQNYRDYWSSILGINKQDLSDETKWRGCLESNLELSRSLFALKWVQQLRDECYSKLTQKRNHVAHGGFTRDLKEKQLKQDFESVIDHCIAFFDRELTPPEISSTVAPSPAIFINLSNHPVESWSAEQLEAAKQEYGELKDLPFPSVDPEADKEEIERLVEETFGQIKEIAAGKTATVHLMGEMTFTYALARRLKNAGIRCVASTTKRIVTDNADGTKTSQFHFVRFREYE